MSIAYLGLDIAKDTYQATLLSNGQRFRREFANQPSQFGRLLNWLDKHHAKHLHACLEATGRYGEDLALYLYQQGHRVSVVNPARIKAYGRSQLRRNKTDPLDADLIADFCQTQDPSAWTPPPLELLELRELLHHYDSLQTHKVQTRNRLQAGLKSQVVLDQLQMQLTLVEQQLAALLQQIQDHLDQHPDLKQQAELLETIPAIGALTAAKLVAEVPLRFENARAFAAHAGVTPMKGESGSSVRHKSRLSKIGSADLRRALYMPAVVAQRCNPLIEDLKQRLAERGKCPMTIIGAAMHKLLRIAYGVLKSGRAFDPNHSQLNFAA